MDVFEFLASRQDSGKPLAGGMFAYPPPGLLNTFVNMVTEIGLEEESAIFILMLSNRVTVTAERLKPIGNVVYKQFCGKANKTFLHRKADNYLTLMKISKPQVRARSGSKKPWTEEKIIKRSKICRF